MPETKKDKIQAVIIAARVIAEDKELREYTDIEALGLAIREYDAAPAESCQAKYEGEPTFTLVGRDRLSTKVLSHWLYLAEQAGVTEPGPRMNSEKFDDACRVLDAFREWQMQNPDKVKLPD